MFDVVDIRFSTLCLFASGTSMAWNTEFLIHSTEDRLTRSDTRIDLCHFTRFAYSFVPSCTIISAWFDSQIYDDVRNRVNAILYFFSGIESKYFSVSNVCLNKRYEHRRFDLVT